MLPALEKAKKAPKSSSSTNAVQRPRCFAKEAKEAKSRHAGPLQMLARVMPPSSQTDVAPGEQKLPVIRWVVFVRLRPCGNRTSGGGRGTAFGSPRRRAVENRGFSKNVAARHFVRFPLPALSSRAMRWKDSLKTSIRSMLFLFYCAQAWTTFERF